MNTAPARNCICPRFIFLFHSKSSQTWLSTLKRIHSYQSYSILRVCLTRHETLTILFCHKLSAIARGRCLLLRNQQKGRGASGQGSPWPRVLCPKEGLPRPAHSVVADSPSLSREVYFCSSAALGRGDFWRQTLRSKASPAKESLASRRSESKLWPEPGLLQRAGPKILK